MSDGSAAPGPGTGPQSTQAPVLPNGKGAGPSQAPPPAQSSKSGPANGRTTDGRFTPKESTIGAKEANGEPPKTEVQKEAYRFKKQLKVYGKEQDFDLDEDGVAREISIGRAAQHKLKVAMEEAAEAKRWRDGLKADPDSFLREAGHDPIEYAKKHIQELIKLEAMSQEERRAVEAERRAETAEQQLKERQEYEVQQRRTLLRKTEQVRMKDKYAAALKTLGLEDTHESLYLMAETDAAGRDDGQEYTAEELAKETSRRMEMFTERYFKNLDPRAMIRKLGTARFQAMLATTLEDYETEHGNPVPQKQAVAPPPETKEHTYLTEAEVDANLRKLTRGR